jgi:tetratricopeptide (TPR) repeat protein
VLPREAERKTPRVAEQLIDVNPATRESALRSVCMSHPHKIGALLLYVAKGDTSPRVRAFAVSQLSALRKFQELADVLKLRDGPLRLAAAFALGDAGIYAGVPILIEALRLSDTTIRGAASHKLREYTKQHFGFRSGAPETDRERAIAKWNAWWNENGRDLVRRGIKEVAPTLEGARLSEEEAAEARKLWGQAGAIIARTQKEKPETDEGEDDRRLRLERALRLLRQALDLDPSLSTARMTRAVLLYEEFDRIDEARRELTRILDRAKHDGGNPDAARKFAKFHLGSIALREKAYRKATLAFSQALQFDESYLDALIGQADAYFGLALSDRAGETIKAEKRREALDSARIAFDRALTTIETRKKRLLDMVSELDVTGDGRSLSEGQVIQAVRRSRMSLQARKADLHHRVGRLEGARQRDDAALEHYRIASKLAPDNATFEKALKFWERVVANKKKKFDEARQKAIDAKKTSRRKPAKGSS